jgi:hypothetical protein
MQLLVPLSRKVVLLTCGQAGATGLLQRVHQYVATSRFFFLPD